MAALDRKTGDTVWVTQGLTDMTSYVAPILAEHHRRQNHPHRDLKIPDLRGCGYWGSALEA